MDALPAPKEELYIEVFRFIFSLKESLGFRTASTADFFTHTLVPLVLLFSDGDILLLWTFRIDFVQWSKDYYYR